MPLAMMTFDELCGELRGFGCDWFAPGNDANYHLTTDAWLAKFGVKVSRKMASKKYRPEVYDCEDFAFQVRVWAVEAWRRNTKAEKAGAAVALMVFSCLSETTVDFERHVDVALRTESGWHVVNSQNGQIVPFADVVNKLGWEPLFAWL